MERRQPEPMTLRQFLEWCERQPEHLRHEFVDGLPSAMAPATNAHNRLILRLYDLIGPRVASAGCDAYTSGPLVPTKAEGRGRNPDALVTCDERDQRDDDEYVDSRVIRYPKFIAEILSPSTATTDLVDKPEEYERLETVDEYLILDSQRCWARLYRRDPATQKFGQQDYRSGDEVQLRSLGIIIDLDALYAAARIQRVRWRKAR
jgi:Uma2 family endonuclease